MNQIKLKELIIVKKTIITKFKTRIKVKNQFNFIVMIA